VVTDHVADVLAQEALDALVKLLDAIDVLLHHTVAAVGLWRLEPERRDLLGLLVVVGDVVTRSRMSGTRAAAPA